MAKPSSIPRKAFFRTTSSQKPPSSPLRAKVLPQPDPVPDQHSFSDQAQEDDRGKVREEEEEEGEEEDEEDDFNPFTSHKSNEASASTSSARRKSRSQPLQAESSLWLFNEDRGADSTNIMQTVMAPWGLATSEDEEISFAHFGKKLQRAPSNNKHPTESLPSRKTRALSPVNDMASRLLSPTHKLTRQLLPTSNAPRRPLSSCDIVPSKSSSSLTTTKFSNSIQTADQANVTQLDPTHQSPTAPHKTKARSDQAAELPMRPLPPPSAMKNPRGISLEPPKSLKKARFADSDENVNRFTSLSPGSREPTPAANHAPTADPFQGVTSPSITNLTTKQNLEASTSILEEQTVTVDSVLCPSNDQQTDSLPTNSKIVNQTTASSSVSNTHDPMSAPARARPTTSQAPNMIETSPIKIPSTPLSPDRPLASRLQSSSRVSRSSRALSVEIVAVNPGEKAKVSDPMEKVKTQHMPLSSFKRLSRTNSANSKVFQTFQAAPTSVLQRASSVNADLLKPSRVVRTLASLSGASEPDSQVTRTGISSGKRSDQVSEPLGKAAEAQTTSSLEPSSGPGITVLNKGKDKARQLPPGESDSSKRKELSNPRHEINLSSDDEGQRKHSKASTSKDSSQNLKAENRRPSNRIHVSERAGSRLSALIELPTPNSTVEAISSGDFEGVAISSNLSMVCQNGGVPQFSTPYSAGRISLPLPPDTIHLSASRPRRSGRKSMVGNRDIKPPMVPLTFGDSPSTSRSADDPNHHVSNPTSSSDNVLPSRNMAELPELAPITSAPNTSGPAASSHSPNRNDSTNPTTSNVVLSGNAAPKNLALHAAALPLTEVKKGKAKMADRPIASTKSTGRETHSAGLKKGGKQANVMGVRPLPEKRVDEPPPVRHSKPKESSACPPSTSSGPPVVEQEKQTQEWQSTSQGMDKQPEPEIVIASPISPAGPTPSAMVPSPSLPEAAEELAPPPRLIRVKRPPVLNGDSASAVSKKSRLPSTSTGEYSNVPSNPPRAENRPSKSTARSASDASHPSTAHPSEVTDVMAPAAPLARVKRPSTLDADSAPTASKKSRVPSGSIGDSSSDPSKQPVVRDPPPTSTATSASDARPLSPTHLADASAPVPHLVRVKRPSALDSESTSTASKKSRVPSGGTGESSAVPNNQPRPENRPPATSSAARSVSDPRPPSHLHPSELVNALAPASDLVKGKRSNVLDGDSASATTAISNKSRVPSVGTGESSRVPSNQTRVENPHATSSSTTRPARDARPTSAAHLSEANKAQAPSSHLVRVKRPSTYDADSAPAVSKKTRVPSAGNVEPSRPASNQPKVANHNAGKSSGLSRRPSSLQSRPRVTSKVQDNNLSRPSADTRLPPSQQVDVTNSSGGLLAKTPHSTSDELQVSTNRKCADGVGEVPNLGIRSAESHPTPVDPSHGGQHLNSDLAKHSGEKNAPDGNPQPARLQPDGFVSLNSASLPDAATVPSIEAVEVSNSASTQVKSIGSSTDRRCTVLLEVPSDFDPCHPAANSEPLKSPDAQAVMTAGHSDIPNVQPAGSSNEKPVKKNSSSTATTNHETADLKASGHRAQAPILTLPKEFDFAFRSTMPAKPRIKDARAQTGNSAQTTLPSKRPPVPSTSQGKSSARTNPLTRSRPDEGDADRAPKRFRSNQSTLATPSRARIGPNRVRNVVGRLNSLAKNDPPPPSSSLARGLRPKPPSNPHRITGSTSKAVCATSQSLAAEKNPQTIPNRNNAAVPAGSAQQSALRNQLMREIRQKADIRASKQGKGIPHSIPPACHPSSENAEGKNKGNNYLADIPEAPSQPIPKRVNQRNVSGASSSKAHNPPRLQEARAQKPISQNSRPAASGFQNCLNQWREVEARQSINSGTGSLSNSVQSRKLPEWQDVSLVHHVLPVKDHSKPKKPTMSFGLATERRILERENWEQTKANKEKIEAEIRAQEELKAQELQREEFIRMRRECVIKANPVPSYLKKHP
ncbi:uncharacterized protein PGTG_17664 [Puccinia graminis f. sp. tritici CRL 75-36-700-3]|uniref:TPX2 C-terminal domain-containing protein n=1 Tax=Puccinia graminis f. sp. tritici (strain CRL 75-36-700-3 / race SCCL) TaxID=418459 RepID=E3L4Y5_PUCGT|nr:uncharacterized protein PGTG_17664 [Puccinia graminis f. sp. tritici CRL 75-36-700-3]EFP91610.2 hypothetical protein PGTG_17664 [Puccinia graminis f. sp. tritici CRL 75-36-700-3]